MQKKTELLAQLRSKAIWSVRLLAASSRQSDGLRTAQGVVVNRHIAGTDSGSRGLELDLNGATLAREDGATVDACATGDLLEKVSADGNR